MQLFESVWEGNSILRWAIAAAILLALPLISSMVRMLLGRTARTGGTGDLAGTGGSSTSIGTRISRKWLPQLSEAVRSPVATLIWIAGIWVIRHKVLVLPDWLRPWIDRALYVSLAIGLGWLLARLAERFVDEYLAHDAERRGGQIDGILSPLFRAGTRFFVWSVVLVLGLDNAGFKVTAVLGGLGLGGLAIAMAAKDLISDLLGGAAILLNRPFAVGDKIMFKGQWSIVRGFGLRTTLLEDFATNFRYVVPNSHFTNNEVTNISAHPGHMILMNIRLSLTNSVDQVAQALKLIEGILTSNTEVRYIWSKLDHFDDYAFTLRIHYDILEFRNRNRVKSEVNLAIARAFQESGIKFAAMPVHALQGQAEASPFVG